MKKNMIIMGFMALLTLQLQSMSQIEQQIAQFINTNEIVAKLKNYAENIDLSQNHSEIARQIADIAKKEIDNLPSNILGVNIDQLKMGKLPTDFYGVNAEQIKSDYINQENLDLVKKEGLPMIKDLEAKIPEAKKLLRRAIVVLSNPQLTINILNDIIYPQIAAKANNDLKAPVKEIIDFLKSKESDITVLAKKLVVYLKLIETKIDTVNAYIKNLNVGSLSDLPDAQSIKDKVQKIVEDLDIDEIREQARQLYPTLSDFIVKHKDAFKSIFEKLKNVKSINIKRTIVQAQPNVVEAIG